MTWLGADELDLLVLGSGVAGLSAAVRAADELALRVGVLTKSELSQAATRWAQGGVAAVLAGDPDSTDLHLADTLSAGADLCDVDAVRVLVAEGPSRVNELIAMGAMFDRDREGRLQLAREGGHSLPRVVHAGGAATGAEIERALVEEVRETAVACWEQWFALDLLVDGGRCVGVAAMDQDGQVIEVRSRHVLLATGGAGPALRRDHQPPAVDRRRPGHGPAGRRGVRGHRVRAVPPDRAAQPQDAATAPVGGAARARRARSATWTASGSWTSSSPGTSSPGPSPTRCSRRTPTTCSSTPPGWSASTSASRPSPPTSAAPGSIPPGTTSPSRPPRTTTAAASSPTSTARRRCPACGRRARSACTGVHGANRLASNSLLEGMVFGPRVIEAIGRGVDGPSPTGAMRAVVSGAAGGDVIGGQAVDLPECRVPAADPAEGTAGELRDRLQRAMTRGAGVLRDARSLRETGAVVAATLGAIDGLPKGPEREELRNLATVGWALLRAAEVREESRGCHTREDFPDRDPAFQLRLVLR